MEPCHSDLITQLHHCVSPCQRARVQQCTPTHIARCILVQHGRHASLPNAFVLWGPAQGADYALNQEALTCTSSNGGCRVQGSVAAAAHAAKKAAMDRLNALDEDGWTGFLEGTGVLDPTPATTDSWVGWAVNEMAHVVRMLSAAAASATVAPASGPLAAAAAAAAGGAGSNVQHTPHLQGPQPAKPTNPAAAAAAASRSATKRMMGMLVPMELPRQPWQPRLLAETGSTYSGAFAMRPLREWLAMRGAQFGPELMAAIIQRYD